MEVKKSSPSSYYDSTNRRILESQSNHYQQLSDLPADEVLIYIDRMLMEEDIQDNDEAIHSLQETSDFQDKERSFYEVLGHKYPPSPAHQQDDSKIPSITHQEDGMIIRKCKKNDSIAHEEFDTWTRTECVCDQELEAQITDIRNSAAAESSVQQKKNSTVKEAADLRSLLIQCAQSIASDDHPAALELLRQVRPYSSPTGNVNQRVAHYFILGLEARLAGTGGRTEDNLTADTISPSDYFLVHCTSFVSTSFRKISIFASNKLIADKSKKSAKVHIVDFGILYGLQWPPLIQRLAEREGGPPRLRITGIDFPQPNCDPSERVESTGSRLAHYAKLFGVSFEYNSIVQSWESIRVEDLKIEEGEFVAVNCLYRAEILPDETIDVVESPRRKVFDLIRKMNPDIFVHAVVNGGYGVPYFVTRFREALFNFSALFDMLEVVIPRERLERMLLEGMMGSDVVNVIACEGAQRVSRPETRKQWQLRYTRAGFKQRSFGRKLVGAIQNKVRNTYHKEFVTTEDHKWLLMSWKGRTVCAISCWQSV